MAAKEKIQLKCGRRNPHLTLIDKLENSKFHLYNFIYFWPLLSIKYILRLNMRKVIKMILPVLFFLAAMSMSLAQIFEPVKWSYETRQTGEKEYELVFKSTIDDG